MKVKARIHSLGGQFDEVELITKIGDNKYEFIYKEIRCTGIFNPFTCCYYVDDIYGLL